MPRRCALPRDAQRRQAARRRPRCSRPSARAARSRAASAVATAIRRRSASVSNRCPASKPASRRMPVPALPQSIGACGARRPCRPTPCTMRSLAIRALRCARPAAQNARAVARVSSPSRKPLMREVPSASAASMIARCEIDLSPGTRTSPRSGPAGAPVQLDAAPRHGSAVQQAARFRRALPTLMRRRFAAGHSRPSAARSRRARTARASIGAASRAEIDQHEIGLRRQHAQPARAQSAPPATRASARFHACAARDMRLVAERRFGRGQRQAVDVERLAQAFERPRRTLGCATAIADAQPRQRVGLRERARDDQVRKWRSASCSALDRPGASTYSW